MADAIPRRKQVTLGIVGTGPLWDGYQEVIRRRAQHMVVRGVYDAVPVKAEQMARECQAVAAPSLTALFERSDLDAVLVLDAAWQGWFALELAARVHKPTLAVGPWVGELSHLEQVHLAARDAGVLLMAALPRRHAPSTNRLRELLATKLGRPVSIAADVSWPYECAFQQLIGLIDWCAAVIGRHSAAAASVDTGDAPRQIELRDAAGAISAQIRWQPAAAGTARESIRIECQHGAAVISGDTDIAWTVNGTETRDSLTTDRSSTEILLDQFCRRVVGGLVPVADLGDVLRSVKLAQSVWRE